MGQLKSFKEDKFLHCYLWRFYSKLETRRKSSYSLDSSNINVGFMYEESFILCIGLDIGWIEVSESQRWELNGLSHDLVFDIDCNSFNSSIEVLATPSSFGSSLPSIVNLSTCFSSFMTYKDLKLLMNWLHASSKHPIIFTSISSPSWSMHFTEVLITYITIKIIFLFNKMRITIRYKGEHAEDGEVAEGGRGLSRGKDGGGLKFA